MKAWVIFCDGRGYINDWQRIYVKSLAALAAEWLYDQREKTDPEEVRVEEHLGWPWRWAVEVGGYYTLGFEKESQAEHFAQLVSKEEVKSEVFYRG
ncbi:MAG: hypothetical protein AB1330_01920 [Bacillota bacterium]